MHEMVKEFLDAKKDAENKEYQAEKESVLIDLGLYKKEYAPNNKWSEEYEWHEFDTDEQVYKYYKIIPIEITDEEYQEVKKYIKNDSVKASNPVANAITVIAWIEFIAGFIAGIILGNAGEEFSLEIALIYWGISLISGIMFLGFAEIIKLLQAIKNK